MTVTASNGEVSLILWVINN